jgi:hypothetical protein
MGLFGTKHDPVEFYVHLSDDDAWSPGLGGWQCDALRIPSAKVTEMLDNGVQVATADYLVDRPTNRIRWVPRGVAHPLNVMVKIEVGSSLVTEKEKNHSTIIAAIITAVAALLVGFLGPNIPRPAGCGHVISRPIVEPADNSTVSRTFRASGIVMSGFRNVWLIKSRGADNWPHCGKIVPNPLGEWSANNVTEPTQDQILLELIDVSDKDSESLADWCLRGATQNSGFPPIKLPQDGKELDKIRLSIGTTPGRGAQF